MDADELQSGNEQSPLILVVRRLLGYVNISFELLFSA